MFYKYHDVIYDKIDRNENLGVILVDKSRVISILNKPTETGADRDTYEDIKAYLKL